MFGKKKEKECYFVQKSAQFYGKTSGDMEHMHRHDVAKTAEPTKMHVSPIKPTKRFKL